MKSEWTEVDTDGDLPVIVPGYRLVNRINFFITEVPWDTKDIDVVFEL